MSKEAMLEAFGEFDPGEYEAEVQERWGETGSYKESARRTANDPRAMDAVDRARMQIDEWFYPCSREMHAELGRMYVTDLRFAATYEKIRPGLARYMCDATTANAQR